MEKFLLEISKEELKVIQHFLNGREDYAKALCRYYNKDYKKYYIEQEKPDLKSLAIKVNKLLED